MKRVTRMLLVSVFLVTGCASGRPTAPAADLGPAPVARRPVLDACPAAAGPSSLPSVTLTCLNSGTRVNMAALGDGPRLVNLWASWCVPCQSEMPALQRAYARYGGQVPFLGVDSTDEPGSANDFLAAVSVHYPQVMDASGQLLRRLGGAGLPVTIVLDRNGKIAYTHRGRLRNTDLQRALLAAGVNEPRLDAPVM